MLNTLLSGIQVLQVKGNPNIEVSALVFDSRQVVQGCCFIAIKGTQSDGHQFIAQAVAKGASSVICELAPEGLPDSICVITVRDTSSVLGPLASAFYGHPSKKLHLVGVTGTNGKTTTVTLLHNLFRMMGYNAGMLSTVENRINDTVLPSTHTTPDAVSLNQLLARMVNEGCQYAFMEVSSHALVQGRVAGLHFKGAIFTNITHDHLDYHKTFDEYIRAKKLLFDHLPATSFALVNADDKRGDVMVQNCKARKRTFSLKSPSDYKGKIIDIGFDGIQLDINGKQAWFGLIGDFNAYNLLGVYGSAIELGADADTVLSVLSEVKAARGRFEQVVAPDRRRAIVDYAHTPDALENVLQTILRIRKPNNRIITVVGCGGNRDSTKRPIMAHLAAKLGDIAIFTSDNPRNEDPELILDQMWAGLKNEDVSKAIRIADRKTAIAHACTLAKPNDIILIAGKGHETYQEIKGVKHPFDDKAVVENLFRTAI